MFLTSLLSLFPNPLLPCTGKARLAGKCECPYETRWYSVEYVEYVSATLLCVQKNDLCSIYIKCADTV